MIEVMAGLRSGEPMSRASGFGTHFAIPVTGLDRPREFQEAEAHRFHCNGHTKVVRLSAVCTGHLYPLPRKYSCYSFLSDAKSTPGP